MPICLTLPSMNNDPRFPIGGFTAPSEITQETISQWIDEIEQMPKAFRAAFEDLTDRQLDTPYREGGWTLRQVAHHVPDSHMNAYIRFKWTLAEDLPIIKAYDENDWSKLKDSETASIESSLKLLEGLHERWVALLKTMTQDEFGLAFLHPEFMPAGTVADKDAIKAALAGGTELPDYVRRLDKMVGLYAWHGRHHTAHVNTLREKMNW